MKKHEFQSCSLLKRQKIEDFKHNLGQIKLRILYKADKKLHTSVVVLIYLTGGVKNSVKINIGIQERPQNNDFVFWPLSSKVNNIGHEDEKDNNDIMPLFAAGAFA